MLCCVMLCCALSVWTGLGATTGSAQLTPTPRTATATNCCLFCLQMEAVQVAGAPVWFHHPAAQGQGTAWRHTAGGQEGEGQPLQRFCSRAVLRLKISKPSPPQLALAKPFDISLRSMRTAAAACLLLQMDWSAGGASGVRALYQSTAAQLGLTDTGHRMPSLVVSWVEIRAPQEP